MKRVLIIAPHFPPSNLAGVHRSRLFAQHLPEYGWEPIILAVHEDYYEEQLDRNLEKLLPSQLRIEKVKSFPITKPRVIGDLGLRAFFHLYKKAKEIIVRDKVDFIYIPIPSFYIALLGRWLHRSTGVKYGIDYIDPWVHHFAGSDKKFSRHWFSTELSKFLEPIAVKKACLITGVAEGYYQGVIERNPYLTNQAVFASMPYGGEKMDHEKVHELSSSPYLFKKEEGKIKLIYAGAMLPKAYQPMEKIFQAISENLSTFSNVEIHFIGTGKSPNDANGFNIKPIAEKYGLWHNVVFEYPKRIPYLDVLIHLNAADGVFILGSTEPHYTPSKVYQGVLSNKPILAILHQESSAVKVIQDSNAGITLPFNGEEGLDTIYNGFIVKWNNYIDFMRTYKAENVNQEAFEKYSAKQVTRILSESLEQALLK